MFKLVIFDLDGTLINSLEDLGTAINVSLKKMGLPTHSMDKFNYFVGNGIRKLCERAVGEHQDRVDELYKLFGEYYGSHYAVYTKPYENVNQLLETLKDNNIKIAVASNKAENFVVQIVSELFPSIKFDSVKGQVDTRDKKPSPEIVFQIMQELGISKEQTVMVGDSNVDITTGKNADIYTIGCLWGFRDYQELSQAGADSIVANPLEIIDLVK